MLIAQSQEDVVIAVGFLKDRALGIGVPDLVLDLVDGLIGVVGYLQFGFKSYVAVLVRLLSNKRGEKCSHGLLLDA